MTRSRNDQIHDRTPMKVPPPRLSIDGERLISLFMHLIPTIGMTLPSSCEAVLHDLGDSSHSIVAIHGEVSGLRVGDPPIESLRNAVRGDWGDHVIGHVASLPDGRKVCSTTMIIRDKARTPVAALCINADLSVLDSVQMVPKGMSGNVSRVASVAAAVDADRGRSLPAVSAARETNVDSLARSLIDGALARSRVPVDLMQKRHKLAIVRELKSRGIFRLRDGVDMMAEALDVTRFTIYNYLNQLADEDDSVTRGIL